MMRVIWEDRVAMLCAHLIMQVDVGELNQILELRTLTQNHDQLPETVQLPVGTQPQHRSRRYTLKLYKCYQG